MKHHQRIATSALFALSLTLLSSCSKTESESRTILTPAEPPSAADLVLRGGVVATVDVDMSEAEAIAVRGHSIVAVGSDQTVDAYIGPETQVIELNGRFVMPGFIEGHGHFMSLGRAQQILDLRDAESWQEIVTKVALAVDSAVPGEWIFGRGWHQDKWNTVPDDAVDGVPLNTELNRIAPDNPVLLGHASGHAAFVNAAALAAADVTAATPDPPGGTIVRDAQGTATGLLRETAQRLLAQAQADYAAQMSDADRLQQRREQVRLASEEALRHGITSFHDAGADFATIDFFKTLEAAEQLPIRLYVMVRGESNDAMAALLPEYFMPAEGNDFLTVRSIKRQLDGALGAHGAWLLAPYADLPETSGLVLEPLKDIATTARIAIQNGFQVNTHAIGDRANREILDLYAQAFTATKRDGEALRFRIEHAQHIHPDDVPRLGELGVIASVQGVHCTSDGPWIPKRLGEARALQTSYPWRDLIDGGALIANGTDVPVEPIDALASYLASVTRTTIDGTRFVPAQAMTRVEALRSYTINNAYAGFEEDIKGSLEAGKLADIVVLSDNILAVDESVLGTTTVDLTIVGGRIKYRRGAPF